MAATPTTRVEIDTIPFPVMLTQDETANLVMKLLSTLLLAACGMTAAPAVSTADVEPNNAVWQAEQGATSASGSLPRGDIADWYAFVVYGQQQVHLDWTTTVDEDESYCTGVKLIDSQGEQIPDDYTTPAGNTALYVEAHADRQESCPSYDYSFQLRPIGPIVPGPPSLAPTSTGEPNESVAEAVGPLLGGALYQGSIDTSNDADSFYFMTAPGRQQVTITAYTGVQPTAYPFDFWGDGIDETEICSYYATPRLEIHGPDVIPEGTSWALTPVNQYDEVGRGNHFESVSFTAPGVRRYDLQETASESARPCNEWLFRIDPPGALLTGRQVECIAVKRRIAKLRRLIKANKRRLSRARPLRRYRVKRRLVRERRTLRALNRAARAC